MNTFKVLPLDIVEHILSFGPSYYKKNYKNRKGVFYKQIDESIKKAISNVYVPIKHRRIKERFTGNRSYFYERFLGGKYVLYVTYDDIYDDDDYEPNLERLYSTEFNRVYNHPHIGYGIDWMEEHRFDKSKLEYSQ
jgi:hypothetical protein